MSFLNIRILYGVDREILTALIQQYEDRLPYNFLLVVLVFLLITKAPLINNIPAQTEEKQIRLQIIIITLINKDVVSFFSYF